MLEFEVIIDDALEKGIGEYAREIALGGNGLLSLSSDFSYLTISFHLLTNIIALVATCLLS